MTPNVQHPRRVIIVGGGIAGLTAAYRLQQRAVETGVAVNITLIEREQRLGGKILTERHNGLVIEGGPDCFLSRKPGGMRLTEELGLLDRLQGRRPEFSGSFVSAGDQLHPLPAGLTGMIPTNLEALQSSPLLSQAGRQRIAQDLDLPPAPEGEDESIASFISRRLGREAYEQLVEPLMGGIYAGDGEQLSLAATFPQLRQLELRYGGLIKGLLASQKNGASRTPPSHPPFVALRDGMAELVTELASRLTHTVILTGTGVKRVNRNERGFNLTLDNGQSWLADAVILATPATATARIVADLDHDLAAAHAAIPYASTAIITLAYPSEAIPGPLDGYGYVVPRAADSDILACSWSSNKWAGRAPEGTVLLRVFAGRYGREDLVAWPDDALLALARKELLRTLDIREQPQTWQIHRWPQAMPQYNLGHLDRLARIEARLAGLPGLFVAGAAYRGVGIPDCIDSGEAAAAAADHYLRGMGA